MAMDKRVYNPVGSSRVFEPSNSRATVSVVVIGLLLLAVVFVSSGCAAWRRPTAPLTFRVMTYNIHHGEGTDGKIDLLRIVEVIQREGADLVALQEVDRRVQRTQRRDLPEELAALTGMTCVFSNNFHFQGGEYGNAVLTRFPVIRWDNRHYKMLRPGEQRGLLQVILGVNGRQLRFMNTHIDYRPDDAERLSNVEEIKRVTDGSGNLPTIVCGDFNDTPGSGVHGRMKEQFLDSWEAAGQGDGFTYSSEKPVKRIDFVFISRDAPLVPLKAWVPRSAASDHLPLVVELKFK